MQHETRFSDLTSGVDAQQSDESADLPHDLRATIWISRATSIVGLLCLAAALIEWALRPGHYRLTLALLVVAMFAAILHSYTFESGR